MDFLPCSATKAELNYMAPATVKRQLLTTLPPDISVGGYSGEVKIIFAACLLNLADRSQALETGLAFVKARSLHQNP